MDRSPFFKPIATTNAISTFIQSLTWFVLSIICFLYYSEAILVTTVETTFRNSLETWIYRLYLRKNDYDITNSINSKFLNITPKEFMVFCSLYFIISIILINVSVIVIYTVRNAKQKGISFLQYCSFITWIIAGLCQCLLDLIFFCLLLDDYNYFASQEFNHQLLGVIPTAIGVVMTLIARGFLLWFFNLVMYAVTMVMIIREYQKDRDYKEELFPPMERRSTLRRSGMMVDDRRPYPSSDIAPTHVLSGRSNDSYISDRYDPFPTQVSPPPQAIPRPSSSTIARFNPPPHPAGLHRYDSYAVSDQSRMGMSTPHTGASGSGLQRQGSRVYGGR